MWILKVRNNVLRNSKIAQTYILLHRGSKSVIYVQMHYRDEGGFIERELMDGADYISLKHILSLPLINVSQILNYSHRINHVNP